MSAAFVRAFAAGVTLASVCFAQQSGVRIESDVPYLGPARSETLDLYFPPGHRKDGKAPAILIVHGGGWRNGDKAGPREVEFATTLARAGYVCASANYLLADEARGAPWPRNLHDCRNAVRFLRHRAEKLGIDPTRIGAIGGSAGGHLVSMIATTDADEVVPEERGPYGRESCAIQAVASFYGVTSFLTRRKVDDKGKPTEELHDGPVPILLGKSRDEAPDLWKLASPVTHVSSDDPPFFITHGTADLTVDYLQSESLAAACRDASVPHRLMMVGAGDHSYSFRLRGDGKPLSRTDLGPAVIAFFDEYLKSKRPEKARLTDLMAAHTHESSHGKMPYRLYDPRESDKSTARYPLVLFLHGAGERGTDNRAQLVHGVRDFLASRSQSRRPCFVLAPQCPRGRYWNIAQFLELTRDVIAKHPIDVDRVYVTGLSMGGYGTWHALAEAPGLFAAAAPVCGGGPVEAAAKMADVPIWAFHGDADRVVPARKSREMIEAVTAAGGTPKYTEYPGVRHNSWSRTYSNEAVHEWLFTQQLESVKPGINDSFTDPELDVSKFVKRFEGESREIFAHRAKIARAVGLQKGQAVADIGAGTGLFVEMFAKDVGTGGKVYAVDIAEKFVAHIDERAKRHHLSHVEGVLCTDRDAKLPEASVDAIFVCDTYHHFEYPAATLASLHRALRPGGQLVVIDFERIPGQSRPWLLGHVRAGKSVFRSEIEAAGFELEEEVEIPGLKENYFLRFRRK